MNDGIIEKIINKKTCKTRKAKTTWLKFDKKKHNEDEIWRKNPKQKNLQLKELESNLKDLKIIKGEIKNHL